MAPWTRIDQQPQLTLRLLSDLPHHHFSAVQTYNDEDYEIAPALGGQDAPEVQEDA